MVDKASAKPATRSTQEIEANLAASRERLAGSIDELALRAQPKKIIKRQVEKIKFKINNLIRTSDGEVRIDKIGMLLGSVSAALLTLGILRRARS